MSTPKSADEAAAAAVSLLKRALPGRSGNVSAECDRAATAAAIIWRQWKVGPRRWRCKHVRWFLEHHTGSYSPWTRYRYWLTVERLLRLIGKRNDWRMQLNGPWCSPKRIVQLSPTPRSSDEQMAGR